jgi:tetratricopeptide (TPR) repeat protein
MSDKAIKLKETAEYLCNRSTLQYKLGNNTQAMADIDRAIALDSLYPASYYNKFALLTKMGQTQESLPPLEKFLKLEAKDPNLFFEAARLHYGNSNFTVALHYITKAIDMKGDVASFYYQRGLIYYFMNIQGSARNDLLKALSLGYVNIDPTVRTALGI